jgi:DNA-directed RNA polymerase specialized sigma24 family protein
VCLVKVLRIVEQVKSYPEEDHSNSEEVTQRRIALANLYHTLPGYGSDAYWHAVEQPDLSRSLPLEVLARCVRTAIAHGDIAGRNRVIEVIIQRTQATNEYWANHAFAHIDLQADERKSLACDLYADLCERLIRMLIDPKRSFWEENFHHCLRFERKHVFQAFMTREGRWNNHHVNVEAPLTGTRRVPRILIDSLDRFAQNANGKLSELDIEDERVQRELLAIEHTDLLRLVLQLPEKLRLVVLLIFWEGRSEKDTAQILAITDRSVRNRLHEASKILRAQLESEAGHIYG